MLGQGTNANAIEGYFYLTADTHRLYVGNTDHSISAVNQGVITVSSLAGLPPLTTEAERKAAQGQFYYVSPPINILCVASGDRWVQINPDTYLMGAEDAPDATSSVGTATTDTGIMAVVVDSQSTNTAVIKTRVQDTHGDLVDPSNPNSALMPVHTAAGKIKIRGGSNVTVNVDPTTNVITLSSPDGAIYTLSALAGTDSISGEPKVDLILSENGTAKNTIPIVTGSGGVTPAIENGRIVLNGGGIDGADAIITVDANGKITLDIEDAAGARMSTPFEFTPKITVGGSQALNTTAQTKTFTYNSSTGELTTDLGVYTKAEIDEMLSNELSSLDAMYFAGTIDPNGTSGITLSQLMARTDLKSGATFKVVSDIDTLPSGFTLEGYPVNADDEKIESGDMIIVTGTETNGVITSNKRYYYIPSGNDDDIYYEPTFAAATPLEATFRNSLNNQENRKIVFASGTDMNVAGAISNSNKTQTITINHATIAAPTTTTDTQVTQSADNQEPEFVAISSITVNNGHVTAIKTKKLQLWSNALTSVTSTASNSSSTANGITSYTGKVANIYADKAGSELGRASTDLVNNWEIKSDTLAITVAAAGTNTSASRVAAGLNVNMVWGSFGTT